MALTEAGSTALDLAEQIFSLGETLPERVREAAELHNFLLENYYHAPRIDVAKMLDELQAQAEQIRPMVHDVAGLLADALRHAPDGWRLEIAGDGPARAQVEGLFLPFGDRVTFLGQVDAAMLGALYRQSDLIVWPGVNEAFGMAYLEAAASGCPSLAMAYGGVGEVVADGVSGHLVAAGDTAAYEQTLVHLLSDPGRLSALGRGAADLARRRHDIESAALSVSGRLQRLAAYGSRSCVS